MKVLVVDDIPAWQDSVKEALCEAGHEVVLASNPNRGLDIFCADTHGEFGAIVTDETMRGSTLTGHEMISRARRIRGNSVRYILLTGSPTSADWADVILSKFDFSSERLLAAVGQPTN
jgi:CheY-like chemotaxis protein